MALLPLLDRATEKALLAAGVKSRYAETAAATIHYYDAEGGGSLPAVVVLHGIGSSATAFARLMLKLRPHVRRVIVPEAPGHGLSGAMSSPLSPEVMLEGICSAIDGCADEPSVVYGCSMGGAVAVRYALSRPARVRGLVLASPAGAAMSAEDLSRLLARFDLRSHADATDLIGRLLHKTPWYTPVLALALRQAFARPEMVSLKASLSTEHLLTEAEVRSLSMPVYMIWGRSDRLLPRSNLDFYRKSLPDHATIEEPEGIGHSPHIEDPEAIAGKIAEFARRICGAG